MNTKALSLARPLSVISAVAFVFLAAYVLATSVHAASTDYYLKIEGVDGESTKSEPPRTTTTGSVQSSGGTTEASADYYLKLDGVEGESKPTPGVEPDEIDYDGKQETNFGVLLDSGGSDDDGDGAGEDERTASKGNVEYGWKVEEGKRISVEARELRGLGEEEKQEFLSEVKAFAELQSEQDLENFARGILLEDERLLEVQFNPKELSVSRQASGKLLGFIPVTYKEKVVASGEDGAEVEIEVKLPWWGFLLSPDIDPEELAAEAEKKHKQTIEIDSWSWGVSNAGSLLKAISDVLKTKHDTAKNSVSNVR